MKTTTSSFEKRADFCSYQSHNADRFDRIAPKLAAATKSLHGVLNVAQCAQISCESLRDTWNESYLLESFGGSTGFPLHEIESEVTKVWNLAAKSNPLSI